MNPVLVSSTILESNRLYLLDFQEFSTTSPESLLTDPVEALLFFTERFALHCGVSPGIREDFDFYVLGLKETSLMEADFQPFYDQMNEVFVVHHHIEWLKAYGLFDGIVRFLHKCHDDSNVIGRCLKFIKEGKVQALHPHLCVRVGASPDEISMIIYDLVTYFGLESCLTEEDYLFLQPVGGLHSQLGVQSGIFSPEESRKEKARKILAFCRTNDLSPIHFNLGVWYWANHPFELVFRNDESGSPDREIVLKEERKQKVPSCAESGSLIPF